MANSQLSKQHIEKVLVWFVTSWRVLQRTGGNTVVGTRTFLVPTLDSSWFLVTGWLLADCVRDHRVKEEEKVNENEKNGTRFNELLLQPGHWGRAAHGRAVFLSCTANTIIIVLTTKNKIGMLKPMLVRKFEAVYMMKTGSLSNVKSNMCLIVFLASAEQQPPSEESTSFPPPPLHAISPTWFPALVDCEMVLKNNERYDVRVRRQLQFFTGFRTGMFKKIFQTFCRTSDGCSPQPPTQRI